MKKVTLMFFILLCSTRVSAEGVFDNSIFGIAFISQSAEIEMTTSGSLVSTESETGSGFGLYLDKYYQKKYRFNGTLSYVTYDTFDVAQFMVSADYLVPLNGRISFFGGLAIGGALQAYSDVSFSDGAGGSVYGAQLGGIMFLSDSLMLELGYRFRPTTGIETEIQNSPGTISSVTDLSEAYLSILLMF